MSMRQHQIAAALCAFSVLACGQKSQNTDGGGVNCQNDPRVLTYATPVTASSTDGTVKISLMQGNPAPPALYTNTWTVKIANGSGNPIANNANISVPPPYMPDHGHFSDQSPTVTPKGSDGSYEVDDVYFFMPGVWQTTFLVPTGSSACTQPGPSCEAVVFDFCVQG
jgi:hypothetical protein